MQHEKLASFALLLIGLGFSQGSWIPGYISGNTDSSGNVQGVQQSSGNYEQNQIAANLSSLWGEFEELRDAFNEHVHTASVQEFSSKTDHVHSHDDHHYEHSHDNHDHDEDDDLNNHEGEEENKSSEESSEENDEDDEDNEDEDGDEKENPPKKKKCKMCKMMKAMKEKMKHRHSHHHNGHHHDHHHDHHGYDHHDHNHDHEDKRYHNHHHSEPEIGNDVANISENESNPKDILKEEQWKAECLLQSDENDVQGIISLESKAVVNAEVSLSIEISKLPKPLVKYQIGYYRNAIREENCSTAGRQLMLMPEPERWSIAVDKSNSLNTFEAIVFDPKVKFVGRKSVIGRSIVVKDLSDNDFDEAMAIACCTIESVNIPPPSSKTRIRFNG